MADAPDNDPLDPRRWLAVWTKPRQEERAAEHLARQGYEVLLPRLRERRRQGRRMQWQTVPLFPRYLFAATETDTHPIAPIRSTRGCVCPVSIGGRPAFVPENVIAQLRRCSEQPLMHEIHRGWQPNQRLRVVDGPFAGFSALFQAHSGEERVRVLLHWLGHWQRAELSLAAVEAVP